MIGKGPKGFIQTNEYTDFRGNVLIEGDTVVYSALSGRSCQLIEATVIGIATQAYQKSHQDGRWDWDGVSYRAQSQWEISAGHAPEPDKRWVTTRTWTTTEYNYKLQLKPTGRYGRYTQHHSGQVWDSVLRKYVDSPEGVKPVWVMAQQATKVT